MSLFFIFSFIEDSLVIGPHFARLFSIPFPKGIFTTSLLLLIIIINSSVVIIIVVIPPHNKASTIISVHRSQRLLVVTYGCLSFKDLYIFIDGIR
jgi:hypothetical protein